MMIFINEILNAPMWGWSIWGKLDATLNVIAVVSIILAIIRYFNNRKKKVWNADVRITDHDLDYDYELDEKHPIFTTICPPSEYGVLVKFKPVNCVVRKMEIIRLDQEGKPKHVLKQFRNITPDTPICFNMERAELIPKYRIKWYLDFGEYCVHDLRENLRNGNNDVEGAICQQNAISKIKKILGFI